jgi:hypothetical protein
MHKEERREETELREGTIPVFGSVSRDMGLVPIRPEEWNRDIESEPARMNMLN